MNTCICIITCVEVFSEDPGWLRVGDHQVSEVPFLRTEYVGKHRLRTYRNSHISHTPRRIEGVEEESLFTNLIEGCNWFVETYKKDRENMYPDVPFLRLLVYTPTSSTPISILDGGVVNMLFTERTPHIGG